MANISFNTACKELKTSQIAQVNQFFQLQNLVCVYGHGFNEYTNEENAKNDVNKYSSLVYTKTVDSVFRALWLATQSVNILHYSLIHLQFLRASDAKLA